MKMTFRGYGEDDPVTLEKIRQIPGVTGIVSAIYDIPVHEDIKTGDGDRDLYIENYCTTLRNLAKAGIDCVCYNFMLVFDWTCSDLNYELSNGSHAPIYNQEPVHDMNPLTGDLAVPGWDASCRSPTNCGFKNIPAFFLVCQLVDSLSQYLGRRENSAERTN